MPSVELRYSNVDPPPALFGSEEEIARGYDLFDQHCGRCHGYGGASSGLGSDLRYSRKAVHDNWDAIVRGGRFLERGTLPRGGQVHWHDELVESATA